MVIVVVVGGYFLLKGAPTDQGMMTDHEGDSMMMSTKEMLALGKDQKCTFTRDDDNAQTSGAVYFSGGKMRGDFNISSAGKTFESHIISDGTDMYNWSSLMPQGIKIKVAAGTSDSTTQNNSFNIDDKVDYDCDSWNPDNSLFTVPTNIQFMDSSAMMGDMMKANTTVKGEMGGSMNMNEMKAQQCAACDAVGDASQKAQCKAALQCN